LHPIRAAADAAMLADAAAAQSAPLLQRLDPAQRISVIAGLVVILTFGGLLLLLVRTGGRLTRWYIDQPVCRSPRQSSPLARVGRVAAPAVGKSARAESAVTPDKANPDQCTQPMSSSDTRSTAPSAKRRGSNR